MELRGTNARLQEEIDNLKVSEDFILLCFSVLHKLEFCKADKVWFPYRRICRVCRTKKIHRTDITLWKPPVQMLNTKETTDTTCCTR